MTETSEPSVRQLFDELFLRLGGAEVLYCVLRNYEDLPERIGNDIDMLVHPKHVKAFRRCLLRAAQDTGWVLIKKPSRFGFESFWFKKVSAHEFVEIDVWVILHWRSIPWSSSEWILENRKRVKEFYVPSAVAEAGTLLVKDVIQTGAIKPKYLKKIREVALKKPETFREYFHWPLGKRVAAWLSENTQKGAWETIEQRRIKIRLGAIAQSFRRSPWAPFLNVGRFLWGHVWSRLARPNGIFVALIGPDGSGKTTVVQGLRGSMRPLFRDHHHYHGRFEVLPRLAAFRDLAFGAIGRKPSESSKNKLLSSGNIPKPGLGRVLLHVTYYSLDYFLGHWIIRKAQARGDIIIFDRYFYDWFIHSYFDRTPEWLLPFLKFILPRPDLVVFLRNSPDIIRGRKPELAADEIANQNARCRKIVGSIPYAMTVSTDMPPATVVWEISNKVFEIMIARQKTQPS